MTPMPIIIYCDAACANSDVNGWVVAAFVIGTVALIALLIWLAERYM